jgi:hypothetical protein
MLEDNNVEGRWLSLRTLRCKDAKMQRCKDAKVQRKEKRLKYILNKEKNKSSDVNKVNNLRCSSLSHLKINL